jgi:alkylation response protein AidB-like acyl-CoA dehydrogenase
MNDATRNEPNPAFNWSDPLLLQQQQLSEDERMVRASAYQYSQEKLARRVLEAFRSEQTDPAVFREMGELGLLGATIPEQYVGSGLNYVCYGLIAREWVWTDRNCLSGNLPVVGKQRVAAQKREPSLSIG